MTQFDLTREPAGEVLDQLMDQAVLVCDRFTLTRSGMILDDRADLVMERLKPFLIGCEETSETPRSIMIPPDSITLCTYRLNADSARVIREASRRLYDWLEPNLPQDLCLLRGTEPWLISLGADRVGFLDVSTEEARRIQEAIPGLTLRQAAPEHEWSVVSRDIRRR